MIKIIIFLSLLSVVFSTPKVKVSHADEDIITELSQDASFSISDWPKNDKLDMELIDFKETKNDKCAVYIYNPTGERTALKISISFDESNFENIKYTYYNLTLLDETKNKVIQKYLIDDLLVDHSNSVRFYIFGTIQRDVFEDEKIKNDSIIYSKGLKAGYLFKVEEDLINGISTYLRREKDVLKLEDQFRFRLVISNHVSNDNYTNAESIVFNTDHKIDDIVNIDVEYVKTKMTYTDHVPLIPEKSIFESFDDYSRQHGYVEKDTSNSNDYRYIEGFYFYKGAYYETINNTIQASETQSNNPGWFKNKMTWNCIDSITNFKKDEYFKKQVYDKFEEVRKCEWFLNYYTSELSYTAYQKNAEWSTIWRELYGNIVTSVVLIRMTFVADGITYNLPIVDDVAAGRQSIVINPSSNDWWKYLLIALILLILIISLAPQLILEIAKSIFKLFKHIVKGFFKLLKLPFKLFKLLFKKSKKKRKRVNSYDW